MRNKYLFVIWITGLSTHPLTAPAFFLLTVPRRFLLQFFCFDVSVVSLWHLFCHCLVLISPYFDVLGKLCLVIVTLPGYLHLNLPFYMNCLL